MPGPPQANGTKKSQLHTLNKPTGDRGSARKSAKLGLPESPEIGYYETMNYQDRITIEPGKCGGRPCIRGMRMRVKDVLDLLAARVSREEILEDYPYLEAEDIDACIEYAAAQADHPIFEAVPSAV